MSIVAPPFHLHRHGHVDLPITYASTHHTMIATPIPSTVATASPQVVRAARNAAKSPHGLINLIRLVRSLEASSVDLVLDDEDAEEQTKAVLQVKKDVQVSYLTHTSGPS